MAFSSPPLSEEMDTRNVKLMGHFQNSTSLRLMAGAYSLAKEDEAKPLGEDAFFISDNKHTVGVADGVGGWAEFGIDSGVCTRQLMGNASQFVENHSSIDGGVDPMSVLNHAFENSRAGASTACIITPKDNALQAVNVGDSGFLVIRARKSRAAAVGAGRRLRLVFEICSPSPPPRAPLSSSPSPPPMALKRKMAVAPNRRRRHFEDSSVPISKAAISRFTSGMAPKYFR